MSARVQRSLGEKTSALSTFSVFASHDFWASVSAETNRYAEQEMGDEDRPKKCYEEQWFDTTPDEIKAYFALCIIMTQVKKHSQNELVQEVHSGDPNFWQNDVLCEVSANLSISIIL